MYSEAIPHSMWEEASEEEGQAHKNAGVPSETCDKVFCRWTLSFRADLISPSDHKM